MPSNIPLRSVRMPDELFLKVKAISERETRSFNQEVVYILKKFVDEYERVHGEINVDTDSLYEQ